MGMQTLDTYNLKGKRVFVRVDLNSPVEEKTQKIEKGERIAAHAETVRELSEKGAKVVVLAHQGRKGNPDCISLEQHAKFLAEEVGKEVAFVSDVCGEKAKEAMRALRDGEILLLENVRFLDDEEKNPEGKKYKTIEETASARIVRELSPFCDLFCMDAFSAAHRMQASIVGFAAIGKTVIAGRTMERELEALNKLRNPERPTVFVLGGAKPEDSIEMLGHWLSQGKVDSALCCGVLGNLFLLAKGIRLGATEKFLEEKKCMGYLEKAREFLAKYPNNIEIPEDVALDENGKRKEISTSQLPSESIIMDIGKKTAKKYAEVLSSAKTILINGPPGVYEKEEFALGTREILLAIEKSNAFSLAGGGHTLSAIDRFGIDKKKIGYISLAGKALIAYLSGKELPGVKILTP